MTIDIHTLITALKHSWSAETAYDANDWSPQNPARGQCAVSSLGVQDYLGGELVRFASEFDGRKEKHYANVIEGALLDVTRSQFPDDAVLVVSHPDLGEFASLRERMLADEDTKRRYELLKERVGVLL